MKFQKSFRWVCTVGTNRGYELQQQKKMELDDLSALYHKAAADIYAETGVYVSAVIVESRTVYHADWGCPEGGEYSFTLSGSCNPQFSEEEKYRSALVRLIQKMKETLYQSTVLLECMPVELLYLKGE